MNMVQYHGFKLTINSLTHQIVMIYFVWFFLHFAQVGCSEIINSNGVPINPIVRRNVIDEIFRSVKGLREDCHQWINRPMVEETFMDSLASRLSLTEAKLENLLTNSKLIENQRSLETKVGQIERLIENNFDRLAQKFEELSDTLRGLQTMVIINHNSTEEKIKKILSNQRDQSSSVSADTANDLQAFWEQKLINSEKLINRHVSLVKDELKELIVGGGDSKLKSWANELTDSGIVVDQVDLIGTINSIKSEVSQKVEKVDNQIKFAVQEINFKLDNQLDVLNNLTNNQLCGRIGLKESRSIYPSSIPSTDTINDDQLITPTPIDAIVGDSSGANNQTISSDDTNQIELIDYSDRIDRRCLIAPNKTSMINCESIPFKSTWKTCADLMNDNVTCDGVYLIMMEPRPSRVWCDMNDNGGGWMVILRRGNFDSRSSSSISFNQNWFLYKYGFGDQKDEYWLGNEHIHRITSRLDHSLQIDLESWDGQCISLDYGHFQVASEDQAYRLIVADAKGPHAVIGEQLIMYNNSAFNTRDRIADRHSLRCGHFHGGWWFNGFACYQIFLTGEFYGPSDYKGQSPGIHWHSWKPNKALKSVQMKIRPTIRSKKV